MRLFLALAAVLFAATPAIANDGSGWVPSWISEVRGGVLTHDSKFGEEFYENRIEPGMDINGEVRFTSPEIFSYILSPKPILGANISTANKTSYAYTGLGWETPAWHGFYAGFDFGLAVHTGETKIGFRDGTGAITPESVHRFNNTKRLGSRVLFRPAFQAGYNITEHHNVQLLWAHISNGMLLGNPSVNQGEDNFGVRYGYRF